MALTFGENVSHTGRQLYNSYLAQEHTENRWTTKALVWTRDNRPLQTL